MFVRLKKVSQGVTTKLDENGRNALAEIHRVEDVSVNRELVTSITPVSSLLIEGMGDSAQSVCRVATANDSFLVLGERNYLEELLSKQERRIIKG